MATFSDKQLATALKRAAAKARDGDKNAERAAKRLAKEIQKRRKKPAGAITRFAAGTSVGIAKTVGAPVDIASGLLGLVGLGHDEPLGGSRSIQRGLAALGGLPGPVGPLSVAPGEEDNLGRAGRVGEVVGTVAVASPAIIAGGLKSAVKHTFRTEGQTLGSRTVATQQPGVGGRIVQDIAETAVRAPKRFVAGEVTTATTAGLAGFEAAQRFPDSPGAQAMAEIAGGFTPAAAAPIARGITKAAVFGFEKIPLLGKFIVRNVRSFISALTPKGSVSRAQARVKRAIEDPEAAALRLGRKDILEEAPLTAAQKNGRRRIAGARAFHNGIDTRIVSQETGAACRGQSNYSQRHRGTGTRNTNSEG